MLNNFAATQAGGTGTVTTTTILDSTIANADVASDAAIDASKINFGNTLEIEGSSGDLALEIDNNVTNSANLKIKCDAGSARADFALDGSNIITMKSQMVGIGDTSPSYALDVNGTGRYVSDVIVGGNLTVGDAGAEDQKIVFDGNAQDFYIGLDDTDDDLVIGLGSAVGTTPSISINEDRDVTISDGAIDFDVASHDGTNGLKLGGTLVSASATELNKIDGYTGTTAELNYLDVTTLGTSEDSKALTQASSVVTVGATDGDQILNIASHDLVDGGLKLAGTLVTSSAAELNMLDGKSIGAATGIGDTYGPGSAVNNAIARFDGTGGKTIQNSNVTISDDPPVVKVGDGVAEDIMVTFDGNAADFRIGLDDGNDTLEIGGGTAHGTAAGISMDVNGDMTLGGGIACADEVIGRPRFTDYAETLNALGDLGGGTDAIDLTAGNVVSATVSTGAQTFTFTNPPADTIAGSFTLFLTNGGSQTVNWPGTVDWAGGSAPSLTSSGVDVLTFTTLDAGTIWYGFAAGLDMG